MKLNIGCGKRRIEGYVGVDAVQREGVDIVSPADKIPLADGVADEILAVHLWEHFAPWECEQVIAEWRRLLKPGGHLVLELPDLIKCCRNILEGRQSRKPDQLGMWGLFGDPSTKDFYMLHRWGWTFDTLAPYLAARGFGEIVEEDARFHPNGRGIRDFRLVARRLASA